MKLELLSSQEIADEIKREFSEVEFKNGQALGHWLETSTLIIGSVAGILSIIDFIKKHIKSNQSENVKIVIEKTVYDLRSQTDFRVLEKFIAKQLAEKESKGADESK